MRELGVFLGGVMGVFSLLGVAFVSGLCWGADVYHHEVVHYPKGPDCAALAMQLSQTFKAASGAEIYWAGPSKETETACDIKISYLAEEPLEIPNTLDRTGLGASQKGTHRTLADCHQDLQREAALFQESTGIAPWLTYCYQESRLLNERSFVTVVEGLGKPRSQFFSSDTIVGVTPNSGWPQLLTHLWESARQQGIVIASLVERPYISASDKMLTIRYYGKERLYLRSDGIAEHKDPSSCERQVETVRKELAKAGRPPLGVYCGKYAPGRYQLGLISLSTEILSPADLRITDDPKQFSALESCLSELPSIIDFYRLKLGKNVLTGICGDGTGYFHATLIEEKKSLPSNTESAGLSLRSSLFPETAEY